MNLNRLVTSIPVDKTANLVMNSKGVHYNHYELQYNNKLTDSENIIEFYTFNDVKRLFNKKRFEQCKHLFGLKLGHLTVLGYLKTKKRGNKGSQWVCKCLCGMYVIRVYKKLTRQKTARCYRCHKNYAIRNQYIAG